MMRRASELVTAGRRPTQRNQLFTFTIGIVILFSLASCKQFSPNKDDVKLKEVEALYAKLSIHPSFHETWRSSMSKSMLASVGRYYKSDAGYDEVKNFYADQLRPEGWQLSNERSLKDWSVDHGGRQLTFTKEQYSVVIEYRGDKAIDPDWNYAVSVGWRSGRAW